MLFRETGHRRLRGWDSESLVLGISFLTGTLWKMPCGCQGWGLAWGETGPSAVVGKCQKWVLQGAHPGRFCLCGHLATSGDILGCHDLGRWVFLASGEWRPGMPLNTLQCARGPCCRWVPRLRSPAPVLPRVPGLCKREGVGRGPRFLEVQTLSLAT